jgi:pyrroline-5-carboxylate reductase
MTNPGNLIHSIGFIGAGNMAGALIRGIVKDNLVTPGRVWANDIDDSILESLSAETGIQVATDPLQLLESVSMVVLSVKPQVISGILESIAPAITHDHLVISIAAGIPLDTIEKCLAAGTRVIRVMPNTPALVGMGAAAYAAGSAALDEDLEKTRTLFSAIGVAYRVEEEKLHAVTALSGSGPAYVFRLMEIMTECGEAMGLDRNLSRELTLQTFRGAAELAAASESGFAQLRKNVTSPGGTTEAALNEFDRLGLQDVLTAGVNRACRRSKELAEKSG